MMTGSSSACSPDLTIWLCHEKAGSTPVQPGWLTPTEQHTVARFSGPRQREYLTSRWLIRQALAGASGQNPAECRPVNGRPVSSDTPPGWRLSLSHSHGLSACAASADNTPIGVDIEPLGRHSRWQKLAKRWFTPQEQNWLHAEDSAETFLTVWTLKEAWLKATERGIAGNLQALEVGPGFTLAGDRPEQGWQACCFHLNGFLITLVYQLPPHTQQMPGLCLLASPEANLPLTQPIVLTHAAAPVLQRAIGPTTQ
jgi:4'-phosphopantetheinyl transferase